MVTILRKAGFVFQTIYEVYPDNAHESVADPEWIKLCGEKNWIVVTGDKRIETVPENRQAVTAAKAKVFLLNDSNSKPEVWAAAVLLGHYKMQEVIDANSGPFFVTVGKRCDTHIQRPRRPFGFPEPEEAVPQTVIELPAPEPSIHLLADSVQEASPAVEGGESGLSDNRSGSLFS